MTTEAKKLSKLLRWKPHLNHCNAAANEDATTILMVAETSETSASKQAESCLLAADDAKNSPRKDAGAQKISIAATIINNESLDDQQQQYNVNICPRAPETLAPPLGLSTCDRIEPQCQQSASTFKTTSVATAALDPVAARRGGGAVRGGGGKLPPGARGRGRQKRVVAAKEGDDKHGKYDICPRAPETLAPPLTRPDKDATRIIEQQQATINLLQQHLNCVVTYLGTDALMTYPLILSKVTE
jgi:hypothetical protein